MEKLTNYNEIVQRLSVFLDKLNIQSIIDEPQYPSILKIKLAIENNYEGFKTFHTLIESLNNKLKKESMIKLFGNEMFITDYDVELDDAFASLTLYYRTKIDDVSHSITINKKRFQQNDYRVTKITDNNFTTSRIMCNFLSKNNILLNNIFSIFDKPLLAEPGYVFYEIPYDILKVSLSLNPMDKNNIVKADIILNEDYVEINHETMRAFKEIVPGNEEKIIYSLVYNVNHLRDDFKQIYIDNIPEINLNEYKEKMLTKTKK